MKIPAAVSLNTIISVICPASSLLLFRCLLFFIGLNEGYAVLFCAKKKSNKRKGHFGELLRTPKKLSCALG